MYVSLCGFDIVSSDLHDLVTYILVHVISIVRLPLLTL